MNVPRLAPIFAVLTIVAFGLLQPVRGVQADSGTITTTATTVTYTHGPFVVANVTGTATGVPDCTAPQACDDYALTINVPAGTDATKQVSVQISWPVSTADFDLYVLDSKGSQIASSATSNDPEVAIIPAISGTYTVRVVPFVPVAQSYTAVIQLQDKPAAVPGGGDTAPSYTGTAPRFQNYAVPQSLGGQGGEPSIGINRSTGAVMYQASLQTLKATFDDSTSPARAAWSDVSALNTSKTSLDAILFTDPYTGRTFASQLTGMDSLTSFTDNDGYSWTPSQGGGIPSGVDHQTIGGGPYSKSAVVTPPNTGTVTGYKDAVYYCSQSDAAAFCARSDDGGLTFGAGVPAWNLTQCVAIHGHAKVAPDGTLYVPNRSCTDSSGKAVQGMAVSTDNGNTFTVRTIPGSTASVNLVDPSIGIASDGTVYDGFQGSDGHLRVAVSHDRGQTWSKPLDVGAQKGIQNATFPEAVAGDPSRAAVAYLGTTTGGNYLDPATFNGVWHLYISTTYDGGNTWTTVDATPNDPVQRGSICNSGTITCNHKPDDRNLLDFMDASIDKQGRVVVGYPDGCINSCVTADPTKPAVQTNSFTALATIARQSGGQSLYAAYDTAQPAVPARPDISATQTQAGGPVTLSWQAPDNGGSAITNYQVFRGTAAGAESLYTNTGLKTTFVDKKIKSGVTYYYKVRAVNAVGAGPFSPEVTPVVINAKPMCTLPGQLVVTDAAGDQVGAPNNADLDIQSVSIAEPASMPDSLVVTLSVDNLNTLYPNRQWRVFWDTPDGSGNRYYAGMDTDATGKPTFTYGLNYGVSSPVKYAPGTQESSNPAGAGSGYSADGTITIVVPKSGVGSPAAGSTLKNVQARTFAGQGSVTATSTGAIDTSGYSNYNVVGNSYCP